MDLVILVFLQSFLVAGVALFAVSRAQGARQIRDLQKQVDSLLDRLAAVDWQSYHRSHMEQERQRTQNVLLAYQPGAAGLPSPEEMETHGF